MKSKNRIGRPPLGKEKRCYRIYASFTLEEWNQLCRIAGLYQISPSELMHRAALLQKIPSPVPKVNLEAIREINSLGNSLKQIDENASENFREIIENCFAVLSEIKSAMMGKE